jgi:biofilm PGA synthesis N-glycosyltransferase PgaC
MSQGGSSDRYVVISPAKDEEARIEKTLQSVIAQTIRPARWVLVDDGSTDRTLEIMEQYARQHDWIRILRTERSAERKLGTAEIRAFAAGYETVKDLSFDFVVKLDTDLELPPDYFELLLSKFHADDRLGIASGIYLEKLPQGWVPVPMPSYHASGASKMVRTRCFEEIGGFPLFPGWDTADEIKAQFRGWETRHFEDVKFHHLRIEGSAMGSIKTNALHGEVYYVCGGGLLFFLFKVAGRCLMGRPFLTAGLAMARGYFKAWTTAKPRLVDDREAKFYKNQLNQRIFGWLRSFVGQRASEARNGFAL